MSLSHHPLKRAARAAGAACDLCPCRDASIPVGPQTPAGALKLIVVGESPGVVEEKTGLPFQGRSGKYLDELLSGKAKIPRKDCYVSNAALCQGETDDEKSKAVECCAPRLLKEITPLGAPIVLLGAGAVLSVLDFQGIKISRGFVWRVPEIPLKKLEQSRKKVFKHAEGSRSRKIAELQHRSFDGRSKLAGRIALPALHPAHVLRNQTEAPLIKIDFSRIGKVARGEIEIDRLDDVGLHQVVSPIPRAMARAFRGLPKVVSLDVETTETGSPLTAKLLCVGLGPASPGSTDRPSVVIWPWHERAAKPLRDFLRTREAVVGHNLMQFDRVVLERHSVK